MTLEDAYHLSQIVLTAIAGLTLWLAYVQLSGIKRAREDDLRISRATFMLELDRRWEEEIMHQARQLVRSMIDGAKIQAGSDEPLKDDVSQERRQRALLAQSLNNIRHDPAPEAQSDYGALMSYCGFFETAAMMAKKGYVLEDDVTSLFRGPIIDIDLLMRVHIEERQNEKGVPPGMFEDTLWLCDQTKLKASDAAN